MTELFTYLWSIPGLFNYFILSIYGCAALWWLLHGSYVDCFYWVFAAGITATVTFGYAR